MHRGKIRLRRGLMSAAIGGALLVQGLASAYAITVQEAVKLSLSTNPDIGVAASNREAVDQELRQARGLYLPQIDASAAWGSRWINDGVTRARDGSDSQNNEAEDYLITLQQRIFDGFEASATVDREKNRVESATLQRM